MPDTALEPNILTGERPGGSHSEAASGSPDDQFAGFIPESAEGQQKETAKVIEQATEKKTEGQQQQQVAKTTTGDFDYTKLSGQKRRWFDEEIKPHWERLTEKEKRAIELEGQIKERDDRLKEYEPFKSRVAELEPLTGEVETLKKKITGYDETLIKGFTPPYTPAADPEIQELERSYGEKRQSKIASLIKSELIDVNDEESSKLAAADANKMNAEDDRLLKWASTKKQDLNSIIEAQKELKKAGFLDPAGVWNATQELLRDRIAIGKKIQERQTGHVQESAKGWEGRRNSITEMVEKRFTTSVEQLEKKIADGMELTDDEVWTAAARLLPEEERVPLMKDAIAAAQEIYAGAKPVTREELEKNPQLLQQLMTRERDIRGKIAPTLLQGTTSKLQTKIMRTLLDENRKLKARVNDKAAATKIERDAGGGSAQSVSKKDEGTMTAAEAEAEQDKAFAKI